MQTAFVAWLLSLLPLVAAWRGGFVPGAWLVHLVFLPWLTLAAWPRRAPLAGRAAERPPGPVPHALEIAPVVCGWLALASPVVAVAWAFDGPEAAQRAGVQTLAGLARLAVLVAVGEANARRRSYPLVWAAWVPGFAALVFALHGVGASGSAATDAAQLASTSFSSRCVVLLADLHPLLWVWRERPPWFALLGAFVLWFAYRASDKTRELASPESGS